MSMRLFFLAIALGFALPGMAAPVPAPATARHAMVATAQHLATRVGVKILMPSTPQSPSVMRLPSCIPVAETSAAAGS